MPGVLKLVSVPRLPPVRHPGVFYSLELHPWNLPASFDGLPEDFTAAVPHADAVGEIGLDRLRGPELDIQLEYLNAVLQLAHQARKPVVFHCVRAFPELLKAVRPYPDMPKLLHGFRGNAEKREMLHNAGFLLSSARECTDGLETDAEIISIQEIYARCHAAENPEFHRIFREFLQSPCTGNGTAD